MASMHWLFAGLCAVLWLWKEYCGSVVEKGNYVLVVYVGMWRRREEESLICSRCFEKVVSVDE